MLGPAACTPSRLCADRFVMSKVFTHSLWASESRSAGGNGMGLSWKRLGLSERGVRCALTAGVPRAAPRALGSADASGHAFHARCIISLLSMRLRPRAARRYATLRVPSSSMRYCTIADACTLQRRRPSHGGAHHPTSPCAPRGRICAPSRALSAGGSRPSAMSIERRTFSGIATLREA